MVRKFIRKVAERFESKPFVYGLANHGSRRDFNALLKMLEKERAKRVGVGLYPDPSIHGGLKAGVEPHLPGDAGASKKPRAILRRLASVRRAAAGFLYNPNAPVDWGLREAVKGEVHLLENPESPLIKIDRALSAIVYFSKRRPSPGKALDAAIRGIESFKTGGSTERDSRRDAGYSSEIRELERIRPEVEHLSWENFQKLRSAVEVARAKAVLEHATQKKASHVVVSHELAEIMQDSFNARALFINRPGKGKWSRSNAEIKAAHYEEFKPAVERLLKAVPKH